MIKIRTTWNKGIAMSKDTKEKWIKSVGNRFKNTGRTRFKKSHVPWNAGKALGLYGTSFYIVWINMKARCYNKKSSGYKRYGGRGIRVYKRWHDFRNFYKDMYNSYREGLTLDRINNNSGYFPLNCRWATRKEQANNTRNIEKAKRYLFNGLKKTVREWAKEYSLKRSTLHMRLRNYNWSVGKALTTPVGGGFCE